MRYLIPFILLLAVVSFACGDEDKQVLAPTATVEPEATATAEPEASSGVLVYLRGTDLWVASLDGESVPPRQVTSDGYLAEFAGFVRKPDGAIDLYYTSLATDLTQVTPPSTVETGVYRVALDGGTPKVVFRFSSGETDAIDQILSPGEASVSPDGTYIMYGDVDGLSLFFSSGEGGGQLLENGKCEVPPDPIEECWNYGSPQWAPAGDLVAVKKGLYEGSQIILVDPFASPLGVTEIGYVFGGPRWSPDAQRLCMWDSVGLNEAASLVYDIATGETIDILAKLPLATPGPEGDTPAPSPFGCAWSEDGRLAVGYTRDLGKQPEQIAVLDEDFDVQTISEPAAMSELAGWLPDGSGVVFNHWTYSADGTQVLPEPARVFDFDRGIVELPVEADRVLGIIP